MGLIKKSARKLAVKLYHASLPSGTKQNNSNNNGPLAFINQVLSGIALWTDNNYKSYSKEGYKKSVYVYRCIRERCKAVSSVPLVVYNVKDDGELEEAPEHPLQKVLDRPNPWASRQDLLEFWELSRMLSGDAYWHLVGMGIEGHPEEIYYLRPDRMKVIPDAVEKIKGYQYKIDSQEFDLEPEEIMHFLLKDPTDDYNGMSPLEAGARTVDISNEIQKWNKKFFQNAARPDGAFVTEQVLEDGPYKRLQQEVEEEYGGLDNAHRPLLLDGGMDWKEIGKSHKDLDFPELKKLSREDICILFETPPPVIGIMENSSYNNLETARRMFWENTIIPTLDDLVSKINNDLAPRYDDKIVVGYDLSDIQALKENENEKVKRIRGLVKDDIYTLNEARLELGKQETDWGNQTRTQLRNKLKPGNAQTNSKTDKSYETKRQEIWDLAQAHKDLIDFKVFRKNFKEEKMVISPEEAKIWFDYVKAHDPQEKLLLNRVQNLFTDQEKMVLTKLRDVAGKSKDREIKLNPEDIVFEVADETERFAEETRPIIESTVRIFGEKAISVVGGSISFNLDNPKVKEFFENKPFKMAEQINSTTRKNLIQALVEGINEGDGIEGLAQRVEEEFEYAKGYRARMIARTETTGASNFGQVEGYRQTGTVGEKQWLAALDERTRTAHSNAHEQQVDLDEPFVVMGEELDYPGDPAGSAKNIIHCRCTQIPIVD